MTWDQESYYFCMGLQCIWTVVSLLLRCPASVGTTLHIPRPIETTAETTRETTQAPAPDTHNTAIRAECGVAQRKHAHSSSVTPQDEMNIWTHIPMQQHMSNKGVECKNPSCSKSACCLLLCNNDVCLNRYLINMRVLWDVAIES